MPSQEFQSFIAKLGLRKEIAATLWDAGIHTPQELAGMDAAQLSKVTDVPLLANNIHPILQKYVFNIAMAKDPYKKALAIVRKHAMAESDDETMEEAPSISADSTVGDAVPTGNVNSRSTRPVNSGSTRAGMQRCQPKNDGTTFSNNAARMNTAERGNMTQTNIGSGPVTKPLGSGNSIMIAGGNFVQANILGNGPVTYNNTNTVIRTSSIPAVDLEKRRASFMKDSFYLNGTMVKASDLYWLDKDDDFWINDVNVQSTDLETYKQHIGSNDVYEVRSHGSSRALILNNISFRADKISTRTGAEMDSHHMEKLLKRLGFKVRLEKDKTAAEMTEVLREFAASHENIKADMTVVYIGSHGERDMQGNDTFVGVDGRRIKFSDVKDMFSPANCQFLYQKPKMFFLQFCRQDNGKNPVPPPAAVGGTAKYVAPDSSGYRTAPEKKPQETLGTFADNEKRPMDMLCVYATLAGSKAYRDTQDGSWFVTALVRVFSDSAHEEDLLSMLTKVNNSVSTNRGMENKTTALQMSEVVNTLRKKVFFYPGLKV